MSRVDQAKMLLKAKKLQKELKNTLIEIRKGEGAVVIEINGEQKIKKVKLDKELIDLDDISELEHWIEDAIRDAIAESQKLAQEKMQPMMGMLGSLGL
ncbi:MAG TPA: YbaB/EbfC family nucleoid-associated protein [Candidatus Saccharimonadales bacterium]